MSLDKILQVAKELREAREAREAREKAASGEWQQWAGIARWSKENDTIFPNETHWPIASKDIMFRQGWKGMPTKFTDLVGRIHSDTDQFFICLAANHAAQVAEALKIAVEALNEVARSEGEFWASREEMAQTALERIAKIGEGK